MTYKHNSLLWAIWLVRQHCPLQLLGPSFTNENVQTLFFDEATGKIWPGDETNSSEVMLKWSAMLNCSYCCIFIHSGKIWSWRQAEKCDLHIHKKQPHKVRKMATWYPVNFLVTCSFLALLEGQFCSYQVLRKLLWLSDAVLCYLSFYQSWHQKAKVNLRCSSEDYCLGQRCKVLL